MKISRTDRNSADKGLDERKPKKRILSRGMQEKLAITVMVIMLALFALIYKLYTIQKENSDEYNQKVLSQQRYDSREIPYRRGDIVDRNGTYLATSEKVYNLIIDPSQINSDPDNYLEPTLALLNEVFGYDEAVIRQLLIDKSESHYIRYEKKISFEKAEEFKTRKQEVDKSYIEAGEKKRVYGIWFEDSYLRTYPYNELACNILGFARSDGSEGAGGIEQYYNSSLIGTAGREYGYLNDDSNLERVIKPAVNGNTIVSTIDMNIQSIVEKYIAKWESEAGSKVTACIVMDPDNGEILAMATSRNFNLNDPRDMSKYYTEEEFNAMPDEEKAEAWNSVWRNFCVSDTFEPGSPSKIFTVSAALEEGAVGVNQTFNCDGYQEIGGWKIRCVKRTGHGVLTLTESLMQSCNDAMMQISALIGRDKFSDFMGIFGLGSKTGIDLPGEADTSMLIHDRESMSSSDLATNSFGQNYNCTMIQMAAGLCSVINGGSYYEPHIVKQILNKQGSVVRNIEPVLVRETVSASTSEFIREALRRTVAEGTGAAAKVEGYDIGGKTGTAEKYPRGQGNYLVSFAGFAPTDNPEVFCYVIIDEPNVEDQPHSSYASGIFKNIMAEILPYMNIFPDTPAEEESSALLPQNEGITDLSESSGASDEETVAESETQVYDTEESIEAPGEGEAIEELPGGIETESAPPAETIAIDPLEE